MKEKELSYQREGRKKTVRYATKARMATVNPENLKAYKQYLRSNTIKNKDVINTTFKVYESNFNIFLAYIAENEENFYILDEDFLDEHMLDVVENYMAFLQEELGNNKKTINNKIAAVSSFYHWATKRKKIKGHPFANRLDRMKNAGDEKIIAEYFLTEDQVKEIETELSLVDEQDYEDYDLQDRLIWHIAYISGCRIGALKGLKLSKLDLENRRFVEIREKRGKIVSVPFDPFTSKLIQQFIGYRKEIGVDCDELFYAKNDGIWHGMSSQSISKRIKKIGHIVGLGDFRAHCIRKTRGNIVAKKDLTMAQRLLNHEDAGTTSKFYTEHKDQADVLDSILELDKMDETNDK